MITSSTGKKILLLGVSSLIFSKVDAPSTDIIIQNKTSCTLSLSFKQTFISQLSLPSEIKASGDGNGEIEFFSGLFIPTSLQQSNAQYVVNCDNNNHILTFDFYTGIDHLSDHNYFFNASTSTDSPFLIIPAGKVLIQQDAPLVITLLNKANQYEKALYTVNTNSSDSNSDTEGDTSNYQQDELPNNTNPTTDEQSTEPNQL